MQDRIVVQGITFDDVLLEPAFSEILPSECNVSTQLTRNISLNAPVISSPMDTVTESDMAIALAQEGGIGIIHKNLTIEQQAREVYKVKRSENGIIVDPVTLRPDATVGEARIIMEERNIGGVPITEADGKLRGILTHRDLRFLESNETAIATVMTKDNLVVAPADTDLVSAQKILLENKVEKLLLIDEQYRLQGLITIKDIDKNLRFPFASKDSRGRLRVGAAIGVGDFERAESVINTGVDVLVVDSAHGHSKNVVETVSEIKRKWSDIDVIAGNVATEQGARDLVAAGVDAVKVGIGPGSICTTRIISGVGVPQLTAISNAVRGVGDSNVPIIADGGIRYSGDVTKALAVGANCVMLGGLLAGLEESPGELILFQGRTFKTYRGMGSLGAMVKGSSERYRQTASGGSDAKTAKKLVPEGVEGRVAYKGPLNSFLYQLIGGLRAGMGYLGARTIPDLRQARFIQVSAASVRENHPHDISITQEAPNYTAEHARIEGP
jgi:IMP dehydrogenase